MSSKSAPTGRIAGLDTLRALAIVMVMVYHLNWRLPDAFQIAGKFGWMGVDLFFVLSGYLIGGQLLKPVREGHAVRPLEFYRRRAYRILPAYLAVLALYLFWPGWREADNMSPLWQFLTFTENLFVDYGKNQAFSHVWSLCVEEHFYLLLPLIVMALARKPSLRKTVAVLAAVFVFGVAIRSYELLHVLRPLGAANERYDVTYIERVYYPTYTRLDGLLAGLTMALVKTFRLRWWQKMQVQAVWLMVAGAVLFGISVWLFYDRFTSATGVAAASTVVGFPLLSCAFAFWIPAAADAHCWLGRWRVPGTKLLATLAFSLYLTHKAVAHLLHERWPVMLDARDWRSVVVYGLGCLLAAGALYFAVERPFLWLRDQQRPRKSGREMDAQADPAL